MIREESLIRERVMLRAMQKDEVCTQVQKDLIAEELDNIQKELDILRDTPKAHLQHIQEFSQKIGLQSKDTLPSEPIFLIPSRVRRRKRDLKKIIKSGLTVIDKSIIGFNPRELSIWSGSNGSGKSTVLSQIALECVEQGFKCALFSGELDADRVLDWMCLQAAGKRNSISTQYENFYTVQESAKSRIQAWLDGNLYIYNNDHGNNAERVLKAVMSCIEENKINTVIIDNMMSLETGSIGGDKFERQTQLVIALCRLAKKYQVHIHFVAHPRKSIGFLRKTDISGTADITNAADNVFIVHRVNVDFKKSTKQDLGFKEDNFLYSCSNVIEICKNRDLGVQDAFAGLYFEKESKRFLNSLGENKRYGWESDKQGFVIADNEKLPFDE